MRTEKLSDSFALVERSSVSTRCGFYDFPFLIVFLSPFSRSFRNGKQPLDSDINLFTLWAVLGEGRKTFIHCVIQAHCSLFLLLSNRNSFHHTRTPHANTYTKNVRWYHRSVESPKTTMATIFISFYWGDRPHHPIHRSLSLSGFVAQWQWQLRCETD